MTKPLFKPLSPEKLNELLLKLRKGSTASFRWREVALLVERMGGSVTPIVGLGAAGHGETSTARFWNLDQKVVEDHRKWWYEALVDALPTDPRPGATYVLGVGPVKEFDSYAGKAWEVEAEVYRGVEGWRVVWVDGTHEDFFPSQYDAGQGRTGRADVSVYGAHRWLAEKGWQAAAAKALGMEEHVPAEARTRDGTGTCGACFENVKIPEGLIALHGYRRPGDGFVRGRCNGTGHPAFEVAVIATEQELAQLRRELAGTRGYLERLRAGDVTSLPYGRDFVSPGHRQWNYAYETALGQIAREEERVTEAVSAYERLVRYWKPRELPREGARQINWFVKGQLPE